MGAVRFEHIYKSFGSVLALNDFDLEIEDGSFLVLLGPSGCGKTTALRLLAGLETPTSGGIYIDGKMVNDFSPRRRNIAMVFQSYALYPHMSVYNNIAFALKNQKTPGDEIDRRVKEAAGMLKISELLERKPKQLSGGQRQRVALARAIVRDPSVFLLDEPLSNLDATLRTRTRAELKQLHQRLGTTFIYVTHDQVEAMTMATKIAVMDSGVIQQVAAPREIYTKPANMFVAGFIGSPPMNFINVVVTGRSGGIRLENESLSLPVPQSMEKAAAPYVGQKLVLGIRPEDIYIATDSGTQRLSIQADIETDELIGNEIILHLRVGKDAVQARVSSRTPFEKGTVSVSFDFSVISLFDPQSGTALL